MKRIYLALLCLVAGVAAALGWGVMQARATHLAMAWSTQGEYTNAYFGSYVSEAGDINQDGYADILVSAVGIGRTYAFYGSADGLSLAPDWITIGENSADNYGQSLRAAGDVNGDGYDDVIVGARDYNSGGGKAYLFYGGAVGLDLTPDLAFTGPQAIGNYGYSVGTIGDVNDDGFADVAIGAPSYTADQTWEGLVYVHMGSDQGLVVTPTLILEGDAIYSRFGCDIKPAGDVNDDGYDDFIVGAFQHGYPNSVGAAFVFYGSETGVVTDTFWMATSDQHDSRFGQIVNGAGDVNNDGFDDVLVGANSYDIISGTQVLTDAGKAYLYFGSPSGPSATPDWVFNTDLPYTVLGGSIGGLSDINQDGYDDFFVSGVAYDGILENAGRVYIFLGSASGPSQVPDLILDGDQEEAYFGSGAALGGDVDGDGFGDFFIGAYHYDLVDVNEGRVFGLPIEAGGLNPDPFWQTSPSDWEQSGGDYMLYLPMTVK
jgi:hypothetical protein